ncbi:unnamed protein product [Linum tenue]|uniref:Uncharacterized protein n=1 Tax=Linum tenue TaxID=586396 RepID=A0AAV0I451_9ROSI|nr:unnamed protein product [Linum tenue]
MAGNGGETGRSSQYPRPALNERILSSMTRRSVAAHPWHDLEIGNLLQASFGFTNYAGTDLVLHPSSML